jgi:hypothetical protein
VPGSGEGVLGSGEGVPGSGERVPGSEKPLPVQGGVLGSETDVSERDTPSRKFLLSVFTGL